MVKKIEFSCPKEYLLLKEDYPQPIKINIPKWFKTLDNSEKANTVKKCMPFLEALTTGYVLKIPKDLYIEHNVIDNEGKRFSNIRTENHDEGLNLNKSGQWPHGVDQVKGSPLLNKNLNFGVHKIMNPWVIKTPPGYSCLFVSPLNNTDDRFSIISGIVETDTYEGEINFPIVFNGDKYPVLNTTLLKGTPYVQVIPFKRDNWVMETKENKHKKSFDLKFFLYYFKYYKDKVWKKRSWN